jgi:hypothetical protein
MQAAYVKYKPIIDTLQGVASTYGPMLLAKAPQTYKSNPEISLPFLMSVLRQSNEILRLLRPLAPIASGLKQLEQDLVA